MDLPPILLSMDVHCTACANMICGSITKAFGVHRVAASRGMGLVQIYGGSHLDPWAIKYFLQRLGETRRTDHGGGVSMWRSRVSVVSAGGRKDRSRVEGIVHLGPKPSYGYGPYYPPAPPPPPHGPYYPPPPPPPYRPYYPPPPPPRYYGARPRWF